MSYFSRTVIFTVGLFFSQLIMAKGIEHIHRSYETTKEKISKKLKTIYKTGGRGILDSFFYQTDIKDRVIGLKIMSNLARFDKERIHKYQKNIIRLERKKADLNKKKDKVQELVQKLEKQEQKIKKEFEQKRAFVNELKTKKKSYIQRLSQIRHRASAKYIQDSLKPSIYEKKGMLPWPIQGSIDEVFGFQRLSHEVFLNHKGIFLRAPLGSAVKSVFSGKVVYARFYKGYGSLVMIDHGGHYYSLYAYNQKIEVKEGQEVEMGQVVAFSGYKNDFISGFKEGLYFELRHFSQANDPLFWLNNGRKMKISSYFQGERL